MVVGLPVLLLYAGCGAPKPEKDLHADSAETTTARDSSGSDTAEDSGHEEPATCGAPLGATVWGATRSVDAPLILTAESGGDHVGMVVASAGDFDGDGCDDVVTAGPYHEGGNGAVYVVSGTTRGTASVTAAAMRFDGAEHDGAGASVAGNADVDGDGRSDVLIGATGETVGYDLTGRVYLLLGGRSGAFTPKVADFTFTGSAESAVVGSAVEWVGDLDGDGVPDAAIGARGADAQAGAVYLVSGAARGQLTPDDAIATIRSTLADAWAGEDLATIGDNDGDGLVDIIVGASGTPGGAAWLFRGPFDADRTTDDADATIRGGTYTGFSVAAAGDVAGDGLDGVLVAWVGSEDQVGLFAGGLAGLVGRGDATATFFSDVQEFSAGVGMAGPGDMDGDGHADVAIGAPGATIGYNNGAPGGVYVVPGPAQGTFDFAALTNWSEGTSRASGYGGSVSPGGDLDGDGLPDLLIGAWYEGMGGQAYALGGGPRTR